MITSIRVGLALLAMFAAVGMTHAAAQTPSPAGAKVYIINLKDGAEVTSPFLVQFGLQRHGRCAGRRRKAEHRASPSLDRHQVDRRAVEGSRFPLTITTSISAAARPKPW